MSMWEPFTERARRSIVLAQEEAQRLGNNYIGTEHILLGIISEGESLAAKVLETLGQPRQGSPGGRGDRRPRRSNRPAGDGLYPTGQTRHRVGFRRGTAAQPQLYRDRAPAPRVDPRRRRRRRTRPDQPGGRSREGPRPDDELARRGRATSRSEG